MTRFLGSEIMLNIAQKVGVGTIFFLWFWREKIITNSYFIFFFMFICQNVGNFKGFLLVCLYRLYLITLSSYSSTGRGTLSFLEEKIIIKYLSIQLLIGGTCRVITDGGDTWLFFPYLTSLFFYSIFKLKNNIFHKNPNNLTIKWKLEKITIHHGG